MFTRMTTVLNEVFDLSPRMVYALRNLGEGKYVYYGKYVFTLSFYKDECLILPADLERGVGLEGVVAKHTVEFPAINPHNCSEDVINTVCDLYTELSRGDTGNIKRVS